MKIKYSFYSNAFALCTFIAEGRKQINIFNFYNNRVKMR